MEPNPKPPIACNMNALTAAERERRAQLIRWMADARPTIREIADGYALRFEDRPGVEDVIRELMPLEENCCPFLVLEFTVLGPRVCEFRMRGPEGSKRVIADEFDMENVEGG